MFNSKKNLSLGNLNHLKLDNRYLFILILLVIFVMEFFVIQSAVSVVWSLEGEGSNQSQSKGVKINFTDYQKAVDHIKNAATFQPDSQIPKNPFGAP